MMRKPLFMAALVIPTGLLTLPFFSSRWNQSKPIAPTSLVATEAADDELPPALARKLARLQAFAPAVDPAIEGESRGASEQDWLEHTTPGNDIPLSALKAANSGWLKLKARLAKGGGAWTALGPDHGQNLFNQFRDRTVYNSGTQNFGGRTIAAEIDPDCVVGNCRLWIANANGGLWQTDDALAAGTGLAVRLADVRA